MFIFQWRSFETNNVKNEQGAQINPQLAEDLTERLDEFGLSLTGNAAFCSLRLYHGRAWSLAYRSHKVPFTIAYVPPTTLNDMRKVIEPPAAGGQLFFGGVHIGHRSADAFRRLGVSLLDRSGNAHIAFGPGSQIPDAAFFSTGATGAPRLR